jgi:protein TonB
VVKAIKVVTVNDAMTVPKIPKKIDMSKEEATPPPQVSSVVGMQGMSGGVAGGVAGGMIGGIGNGPPVVVKAPPPPPKKVNISGGVMAGQILEKTQPVYPPIAKQAHVQGQVVLHATISKTGNITNLTVVSGNAMLTGAAVDAVRNWRYKPYLLNGEPTEVETTVTVNFNFGSS